MQISYSQPRSHCHSGRTRTSRSYGVLPDSRFLHGDESVDDGVELVSENRRRRNHLSHVFLVDDRNVEGVSCLAKRAPIVQFLHDDFHRMVHVQLESGEFHFSRRKFGQIPGHHEIDLSAVEKEFDIFVLLLKPEKTIVFVDAVIEPRREKPEGLSAGPG